MKNVLKALVGASALVLSMSSSAAVLTFDDLTSASFGVVPTAYAGYTFNNWTYINNPPYWYPSASGTTILYNTDSSSAEILFGGLVDVDSVFLADYSTSNNVTLQGFAGATLKYTAPLSPVAGSMTQYFINFVGIDRFVFGIPNGQYAFIDSIEVNSSTPVPEPVSLLLLAAGGVAMGLSRRRAIRAS